MKIETITYKRVKNLGNFQNETFEATATLEDSDDAETAARNLKTFVTLQLYPPEPVTTDSPAISDDNAF